MATSTYLFSLGILALTLIGMGRTLGIHPIFAIQDWLDNKAVDKTDEWQQFQTAFKARKNAK